MISSCSEYQQIIGLSPSLRALPILKSLTWRACPIFYFPELNYQLNVPDFPNHKSNFDSSPFHVSHSLIDIVAWMLFYIITSKL